MESVVIIGAGQASAFAVLTLRKEGFNGRISIISDEENVFYERPPLSKGILSGTDAVEKLAFFNAETIKNFNIDWHRPLKATHINRGEKTVSINNGTDIPYDKLIIATGSRPRVPNEKWLKLNNVYTLRTIQDALTLKEMLTRNKTIAIIGGGWIGLEVAATANTLGLNVHVFEREARLCSRSVISEVSDHLYMLHQNEGTHIYLNASDITLSENDDQSITIHNGNLSVTADIVLVGAGAEIATELALKAGLDVNGGIVVNEFGQTSDPDIYAAGDVAIHPTVGFCTQSWAHAQQQAVSTAQAIMKEDTKPYTETPWIWSDQYQHNVQIMGLPLDENCQLIIREGDNHQKTFIHLDQDNQVRSIIAFNDPKAIGVGRMWFKRKNSLDPEKLADSSIDIMNFR